MENPSLRHSRLIKAAMALGLSVFAAMAATAQAAPKKNDNKPAASNTARVAPDFTWIGAGGKVYPGKNFRGQPVVILIAASPDAGDLRKQAKRIEDKYLDFAAKKTIFVAAFTGTMGRVESNVPFVIAQNGGSVAANYGVQSGKGIAVIVLGPDGNVDFTSTQVEGAQRILDIINNTFQTQAAERTGTRS